MSQDNIIALTGRGEISDPLTELLRIGARQLICQAVNYLAKVITGVKFKNGIEVTNNNQKAA